MTWDRTAPIEVILRNYTKFDFRNECRFEITNEGNTVVINLFDAGDQRGKPHRVENIKHVS